MTKKEIVDSMEHLPDDTIMVVISENRDEFYSPSHVELLELDESDQEEWDLPPTVGCIYL